MDRRHNAATPLMLGALAEARELQARHAPAVLGAVAHWLRARFARLGPVARPLDGDEIAVH